MKVSCKISLGAFHFNIFLVAKLECGSRTPMLYSWSTRGNCKIRFVEQLRGVITLRQTRENKTSDSRTCIQDLLNSGEPHPGLPELRCRSIV